MEHFTFLATLLIFLISSAMVILFSRFQKKSQFDERQLQIRSHSYLIAYSILIVYIFALLFCSLLFDGLEIIWPEALLMGILLDITLIQTWLILKDAFYPVNEETHFQWIYNILMGSIWLIIFLSNVNRLSFRPDAADTIIIWIQLGLSIHYIWVGVLLIIKKILTHRSEPSE